jgi:type IV pilus assembly protein PilY1
MIRKKFTRILVAAMFLLHLPLQAEDIDLFSLPPGTGSGVANVLFLIDNTANWNGPFTNEKTALVNVFNALPTNTDGTARVNVGIMLFTETGNPNNNVDGGYIRAAIRPMNTANRAKYSALINSFDKNADKSNGGKAGKTMAEAYYYFSSTTPYSGNSKAKTDYTGNTSGTAVSNAVYALTGNALSSFAGTQYAGPTGGACANNYIIYISNGAAQDNSSDNSTATTLLSNAGGSTSTISISPSGSQSNVADEWARWMKQSPQKITIYTLDIDKVTNGQGPGWTAMLKSMAGVSGGKYFDVSSGVAQNIADALNTVLGEILAANSVFASVSLPASANAQSTFLNQVFIGMFRPDSDALPRWNGNLKHYKLGVLNGDIKLLDANGNGAININQGFITECARSYWTPSAVDTYWTFKPQGECATVANSKNSNYPDGPIVEKGAQGYVLRSSTIENGIYLLANIRVLYFVDEFLCGPHSSQQPGYNAGPAHGVESLAARRGHQLGTWSGRENWGRRAPQWNHQRGDAGFGSWRCGPFASGRGQLRGRRLSRHQCQRGRCAGGGLLLGQRRHAARDQRQPDGQHWYRYAGQGNLVLCAAGILGVYQANL